MINIFIFAALKKTIYYSGVWKYNITITYTLLTLCQYKLGKKNKMLSRNNILKKVKWAGISLPINQNDGSTKKSGLKDQDGQRLVL